MTKKRSGGPPSRLRSGGAAKAAGVRSAAAAQATIRDLTAQLGDARAEIVALRASADTDFLLDIPNRRGFTRELTRAIAYIRRYRAGAALMVLDVDRLKPINDAHGHAAGDQVLKAVVEVLRREVRASDLVGRLGGDEFALLLWNLGEADARLKAAALEAAIDRLRLNVGGAAITVGASVGIDMLAFDTDAAQALARADLAMYASKTRRRR